MNHLDQSDLLARYFAGEASAEERAKVDAWRQAAAENQRVFAESEKIWRHAAHEKSPRIPDIDQSWRELANRLGLPEVQSQATILEMKKPVSQTARRSSWNNRYLWAAAAVLMLGLGAVLYRALQNPAEMEKVATAFAENQEIHLPDGSVVRLNSGSELRFPKSFADSDRTVTLSGEAYFEVRRDDRPFLVNTANAQVSVLGTKFGIWARDEETRVTVREGRVRLRALQALPETAVDLAANQMSLCRQKMQPEAPQTVDAARLLGWLEGRIVFEKTPLAEVIAELERVYDVSIELSNPQLGHSTITGSFQDKPVESMLASICLTLDLQYVQKAGKYVISE